MGRSGGRIQNTPFLQGSAGIRWRNNRIRVEYFLEFSSLQILQEIQNDLRKRNIEPEKIHRWDHLHVNVQQHGLDKDRNDAICISNSEKVKEYARGFSQGHWSFLGPGEKKWYGTLPYTPEKNLFHSPSDG